MRKKLKTEAVNRCPPHYWILDSLNVGRCKNPGCGAVRDFGAELAKWMERQGESCTAGGHLGGPRKKRGRLPMYHLERSRG